jgi:hypothetical protein
MHPQARTFRRGDLLFMAYLEGMSIEPAGKCIIVSSPSSEGVCVADDEHIEVYGCDDIYAAFEAVTQRWIELGAPGRRQYRLEVWPRSVSKLEPKGGWLVQRGHSQLVFRLKRHLE